MANDLQGNKDINQIEAFGWWCVGVGGGGVCGCGGGGGAWS